MPVSDLTGKGKGFIKQWSCRHRIAVTDGLSYRAQCTIQLGDKPVNSGCLIFASNHQCIAICAAQIFGDRLQKLVRFSAELRASISAASNRGQQCRSEARDVR